MEKVSALLGMRYQKSITHASDEKKWQCGLIGMHEREPTTRMILP